jgi:DNA-binding GntR family transcriptional regulator
MAGEGQGVPGGIAARLGDVARTVNSGASGGISTRTPRARAAARPSFEPAYLHIANTIAEQIGAGVYRPGDQLPTEPQLRAMFGVSPATIRRAVNILLDRGLVNTTQGKGTFVRSPDLGEAVFRLQEVTDMWTEDAASVDVHLLEMRILPARDKVAEMLQLEPGDPMIFMRRRITRGGLPLIYQVEHVVYDEHRPLVETQLQITSLDGLLQGARGEGIPSGQLTIQACSLDAEAAKSLQVPENSPAFCLEHLFLSWGRFLCRADQFRLTTHIGVPRHANGEA